MNCNVSNAQKCKFLPRNIFFITFAGIKIWFVFFFKYSGMYNVSKYPQTKILR